ncbi:MAG TPA: hypothetical protein DCM14_05330, partial [Clostridiales bacterium UBA8153]|nr:hypothetical protein [Clostridiales bacterium UBA8153]
MAGQLIQRGEGTWLVCVYLGLDADGKRKYHNKPIHGNKRDAQRYLNRVRLGLTSALMYAGWEATGAWRAILAASALRTCVVALIFAGGRWKRNRVCVPGPPAIPDDAVSGQG